MKTEALIGLSFLFTILFLACDTIKPETKQQIQTPNLAATKWGYNLLTDIWCDVYHFTTDSALTSYSCEIGDTLQGVYYYNVDTLIIEEFANYTEGYIPTANTCEMPEKIMYKFIIKGNKMYLLKKYNWVNDAYIKSEETFDSSFFFTNIK